MIEKVFAITAFSCIIGGVVLMLFIAGHFIVQSFLSLDLLFQIATGLLVVGGVLCAIGALIFPSPLD